MKNIYLLIMISLFSQKIISQISTEKYNTENLLIGNWMYFITVDQNDEEVKYIIESPNPELVALGIIENKSSETSAALADIKLNQDFTYSQTFYGANVDSGEWKFVNGQIEFKTIVPKNSELAKMMLENEKNKTFDNKFIKDKEGNYFHNAYKKIISINEKELKLENKNFIAIFRKR